MKKIDLSVVIPCLIEDETIELCINKAKNSFKKLNIVGEVVVVDNGSTDNSVKICKKNKVTLIVQIDLLHMYLTGIFFLILFFFTRVAALLL